MFRGVRMLRKSIYISLVFIVVVIFLPRTDSEDIDQAVLLRILEHWHNGPGGDLTGDGQTDHLDLLFLSTLWKLDIDLFPTPTPGAAPTPSPTPSISLTPTPVVTPPTVLIGTAMILGQVFHAQTGEPLEGARVTARYYPAQEGTPDLAPVAVTDANGFFTYETVEFEGIETFLLQIRYEGYAENLRRVEVMAGRCWRVQDAYLNPIQEPILVQAETGGVLTDQTGQIELMIPPDALEQDSEISITILARADAIRDELPSLVSEYGTFIDVHGVFGDKVNVPVTLRIPNQFNLPEGTRVPLGKIDHNTLEWMDLRTAFGDEPPDDPDVGIGIVRSDGQGGTFIEVQFNHFCTICTGYCLPYPPPDSPPPPPPPPDDCPDGPGPNQPGNSVIDKREGFLQETHTLPGMTEFGVPWNLSLVYSSQTANPSVTLRGYVDYNSTRPVERTIFEFNVEGIKAEAAYDYSENNQKHHATYIWNGRNVFGDLMPTGSYDYSIRATSLNADAPVSISSVYGGEAVRSFANISYPGLTPLRTETLEDRVVLVNQIDSPFGAGWGISAEERLYFDPDGCLILIRGYAEPVLFVPREGEPGIYDPEAGDFSIMVWDASSGFFIRTDSEQVRYYYSTDGLLDRIVDLYGYETRYEYAGNLLQSITSPTGYQYAFEYENGRLSAITDSAGRRTEIEIDANGNLVSILNPDGSTRTFAYDNNHTLTSQTGVDAERSEYVNRQGRVVQASVFDKDGNTLLRRREFIPSALNGEVIYAFSMGLGTLQDPIPVQAERVDLMIDGRGQTWRDVTSGDGSRVSYIDPLGRVTEIVYNNQGQIETLIRPDGSQTGVVYDSSGEPASITQPGGGTLQREYQESGLLVREVDVRGNEQLYTYDEFNRVSMFQDASGNQIQYEYANSELPDRVTRITDSPGNTTTFTYDSHGNLLTSTDSLQRTASYTYDNAGNRIAETDPAGNETQYVYDAHNRLIQMTNALNQTFAFEYQNGECDCTGSNLTRVTYPNGASVVNQYDGLGRRTVFTDALNLSKTYEYDPEDHLIGLVNRNGDSISYTYDEAGQLVRKETSDDERVDYQFDVNGNLVDLINAHAQITRTYNGRNLITRTKIRYFSLPESAPAPQLLYFIQHEYDAYGNRTALIDHTGSTRFQYNAENLVTSISNGFNQNWSFEYDVVGNPLQMTRPNLLITTWNFTPENQLSSLMHQTQDTNPAYRFQYPAHDSNGNILTQTVEYPDQNWTFNFSYDALSQLTSVEVDDFTRSPQLDFIYQHDAANRLISDGVRNFSYDGEGQLTQIQDSSLGIVSHFEYDAEGKLVRFLQTSAENPENVIADVRYVYDPAGHCIWKDMNGVVTYYIYDGNRILHEFSKDLVVTKSYTYGFGYNEPLAFHDYVRNQTYYYHTDHLSNIIAISDADGNYVEERLFDVFGPVLVENTVSLPQIYAYTGKAREWVTNTYNFFHRYYEPASGRFHQEDPSGFSSGDYHLYRYVGNNPVNLIDPDGRQGSENYQACWNTCHPFKRRCDTFRENGLNDLAESECNDYNRCLQDCRERLDHVPRPCATPSIFCAIRNLCRAIFGF
jgi:RHS repeat-associated protein